MFDLQCILDGWVYSSSEPNTLLILTKIVLDSEISTMTVGVQSV